MADSGMSAHVTRGEFYGALGMVWLYISLVLGDLLRLNESWSTGILFAVSLLMALIYNTTIFVAVLGRGAAGKKGPPPSDRVKEIARDPDRKIEAIKVYREETGAGLAEAKEAVETYINSL